MQHYKPKSLEERGLKEVLGDQYNFFIEHVELANHRKLIAAMGIKEWKFYRALRMYKEQKKHAR